MDTTQFHTQYAASMAAFLSQLPDPGLRIAVRQQGDPFFRQCALAVWQAGGTPLSPAHTAWYNALYSGSVRPPDVLFWALTAQAGGCTALPAPPFFSRLCTYDRQTGHRTARAFLDTLAAALTLFAQAAGPGTPEAASAIASYLDQWFTQWQRESLPGNPVPPAPSLPDSPAPPPAPIPAPGPQTPAPSAPTEEPTTEALLAQLDELCGLETVKAEVRSLMNLVKVRQLREEVGLPTPPLSLHMVFLGNPGTGKTTVARLVAGLYKSIGVLSQGQLVEVDRAGLVAGYVGQTALKTQTVLQSALGGVLFLDEAYALAGTDSANDFGHEAIEVLLKNMEDHRDDLIVIVAGYTELMGRFIHSNPGLESRFNKYFYFEDYTGDQLMEIFRSMCGKNGYTIGNETEKYAEEYFAALYEERDENFGNARDVRNVFERAVARQSDRVAALEAPTKEQLMELTVGDLREEEPEETHTPGPQHPAPDQAGARSPDPSEPRP